MARPTTKSKQRGNHVALQMQPQMIRPSFFRPSKTVHFFLLQYTRQMVVTIRSRSAKTIESFTIRAFGEGIVLQKEFYVTKNPPARLRFALITFIITATILAGLLFLNRLVSAAPPNISPSAQVNAQERERCLDSGNAISARHAQTGKFRFVAHAGSGALPQPAALEANASAESAARGYFSVCGSLFGLTNQATELNLMRENAQRDGMTMVRFQQTYRGIPVMGGELIANITASRDIRAVTGEVLPNVSLDTTPRISSAQAQTVARQAIARKYKMDANTLAADEPALWIFNPILVRPGGGMTTLVWRMNVAPQGVSDVRELVLVDAQRGFVTLAFNQIDNARNRRTYTAGGGFSLPGTLVCNEANPTCSGGDADAKNAHKYAGETYDFYSSNHGRDSIDNAGMDLISTVHYGVGYQNAFWDSTQMVYGDGFSQADDVVGHELTHGVTEHESGLYYYYQSGAMNESFSDVWGEFVDLTNSSGTDTSATRWQMGEDIPGFGAIRDMQDPTVFGDPDKMTSANYYPGPCGSLSSQCDSGGVHINSGVNNKAVYLMVDGGTFNGKTITGIGIPKVAKIYYRVQTNYLTSGSDYDDLYSGLNQACSDLIGSDGITSDNCTQVKNAALAVEMNKPPYSSYNPEAKECNSGSPSNVFFDNMESGAGNWTFGAVSGSNLWQYGSASDNFAHSGTKFLFAETSAGSNDDSYAAMTNNVAIPANAYLWFAHAYAFEDPNYDGGVVEYSVNGGGWTDANALFDTNGYNGAISGSDGNPIAGRQAFLSDSHGYISSRLNLASLAGSNVKFRWRVGLDAIVTDRGWWLDDVRIYTCSGSTATPTATATATTPGGATNTPTQTATATPTTPVQVVVMRVYTTNKNNVEKTQFKRGEKIRYYAQVNNSGASCAVNGTWLAKGKGTTLASWQGPFSVEPGTSYWYLQRKIPNDAPFRKYKLTITINCNGVESSGWKKFSVVAGTIVNEDDRNVNAGVKRAR